MEENGNFIRLFRIYLAVVIFGLTTTYFLLHLTIINRFKDDFVLETVIGDDIDANEEKPLQGSTETLSQMCLETGTSQTSPSMKRKTDSMNTDNLTDGLLLKSTTKSDPMYEYHFTDRLLWKSNDSSVNPHPFHFTLNPSTICDHAEVFLLIYIHSRPHYYMRRKLIRETWGNLTRYQNVVVRRVFVMGEPRTGRHKNGLHMENEYYGDIVQENFFDSYRNLTYKAIAALKWITTYCSHAQFILKTDDDAFVNMFALLRHLQSRQRLGLDGNRTLVCNAWERPEVLRSGKWAVSLKERSHPIWPTFCQGLAFIMSQDVVSPLYNVSYEVPFLWMDDVYVTGFLAMKIGVKYRNISNTYVDEDVLIKCLSGSKWYSCLFSHIYRAAIFVKAWRTLTNRTDLPEDL